MFNHIYFKWLIVKIYLKSRGIFTKSLKGAGIDLDNSDGTTFINVFWQGPVDLIETCMINK